MSHNYLQLELTLPFRAEFEGGDGPIAQAHNSQECLAATEKWQFDPAIETCVYVVVAATSSSARGGECRIASEWIKAHIGFYQCSCN